MRVILNSGKDFVITQGQAKDLVKSLSERVFKFHHFADEKGNVLWLVNQDDISAIVP